MPWTKKTAALDEHFTPPMGLSLEDYARSGDIGGAHHIARYLWLSEVLEGTEESLLDLGCGSGYGSFLVANSRPGIRVLGIDYDATGIEFAVANYRLPNLRFLAGNAMTWELPDLRGEFAAVVSFDSIEHIPHRELVLENVVRHLSPSGRFYLSTPCGTDHNELSPEWQAHRLEYGALSLFDFLSRYFRKITRPEDAEFPGRQVFDEMKTMGMEYLLRCNPLIGSQPVRLANPYRPAADGGRMQGI